MQKNKLEKKQSSHTVSFGDPNEEMKDENLFEKPSLPNASVSVKSTAPSNHYSSSKASFIQASEHPLSSHIASTIHSSAMNDGLNK